MTEVVLEQKVIKNLFRDLINRPKRKFPAITKNLCAPNKRGVYIIYDPYGQVGHVGQTPRAKGGIARRLNDHLHGRSSYTIKQKLYSKEHGSLLRDGYEFRCLAVDDNRQRALLEAYATGKLCPSHIGVGQIVSVS